MGCAKCGNRVKQARRLTENAMRQRQAATNFHALGSYVRELSTIQAKADKGVFNRLEADTRIRNFLPELGKYSTDIVASTNDLLSLFGTGTTAQISAAIDLVIVAATVKPFVSPTFQ